VNYLAVSSKRVKRSEGNKSLRELAAFMSMLGEKNNHSKITVDSVNLGLCDARDYFLALYT